MANWLSENLWDGADAVLLCTGMEENERFVQDLGRAQARLTPDWFDGLVPVVYHKLLYTAPFQPFEGLRELVLKIREAAGLRACYQGIAALDLSEWLGHEQEEYLTISFKYLHDHRKDWRILFTFGAAGPDRILRMMQTAAPFLRPSIRQMELFRNEGLLESYLTAQAPVLLQPRACALLVKTLMASPALHNCALVLQILEELSCGHSRISCRSVQDYLTRPGSLTALLGCPARDVPAGPPDPKVPKVPQGPAVPKVPQGPAVPAALKVPAGPAVPKAPAKEKEV